MEKLLSRLNGTLEIEDYSSDYKIEEKFGGSSLSVVYVGGFDVARLDFDDAAKKFTISTSGSMWSYEGMLEFKKQFDDIYNLVMELNVDLKRYGDVLWED